MPIFSPSFLISSYGSRGWPFKWSYVSTVMRRVSARRLAAWIDPTSSMSSILKLIQDEKVKQYIPCTQSSGIAGQFISPCANKVGGFIVMALPLGARCIMSTGNPFVHLLVHVVIQSHWICWLRDDGNFGEVVIGTHIHLDSTHLSKYDILVPGFSRAGFCKSNWNSLQAYPFRLALLWQGFLSYHKMSVHLSDWAFSWDLINGAGLPQALSIPLGLDN